MYCPGTKCDAFSGRPDGRQLSSDTLNSRIYRFGLIRYFKNWLRKTREDLFASTAHTWTLKVLDCGLKYDFKTWTCSSWRTVTGVKVPYSSQIDVIPFFKAKIPVRTDDGLYKGVGVGPEPSETGRFILTGFGGMNVVSDCFDSLLKRDFNIFFYKFFCGTTMRDVKS
jgi:hypothetical protein